MIITVTNQKGGSCKTTTAALIAYTLAAEGKDVLCVDGDPQGGLSSLFGVSGNGTYDALSGQAPKPISVNGLRVLPADHRLDLIAYTLPHFAMGEALSKYTAEVVVIDTPPTVQGISRAAAAVADIIVVPADIARTTINPTVYTLDQLGKIKKIGRVVLIGREPRPEAHGYDAELFREFSDTVKKHLRGIMPKTAGARKAAAGAQKVPKGVAETIRGIL